MPEAPRARLPACRQHARPAWPGRTSLAKRCDQARSDDFGALDDHVFLRHVLMEAAGAGLDLADRVDHVHALADLAEHAIAPALQISGLEIEEVVVGDVDEELRGGRVRGLGARHGDGAALVLEAVVGFVLDLLAGRLLVHARLEAAALDHEAVDDAMEHGVVVVAGLDVGEEVGHGDRGLLGVELEGDDAVVGVQFDCHCGFSWINRMRPAVRLPARKWGWVGLTWAPSWPAGRTRSRARFPRPPARPARSGGSRGWRWAPCRSSGPRPCP